ncbi:uncharacterized protein LODBEIA_P06760 [Lodderomyces beijingensis]|uniref:Tethering factor for nuclear proteasome STS1 n=1 Tax=Lodderomyces beijingensis TaxID=1775926 RepID=A0ABP0ZJW4_9ASCO
MMSTGSHRGDSSNSNPLNKSNIPPHMLNNTPRSLSDSTILSHQHAKKRKRFENEEDRGDGSGKFNYTAQDPRHRNKHSLAPNSTRSSTSNSSNSNKRIKTPKIIGHPLPTSRIIESLDKTNLQKLLLSLVDIHPELNKTIGKITPMPSTDGLLNILNQKFTQIIDSLPYKCDSTSDYSYLRVKPFLHEFLSCLEDYVLHILPHTNPHKYHRLSHALNFLHEATSFIHKLPNFTNSEYQYIRNTTHEQLANCWLIILNQEKAVEEGEDFYKVVEELQLVAKLKMHALEEAGGEKFKKVLECVELKLFQAEELFKEQANGDMSGNYGNRRLNELITVDYSQYSLANPSR